MTDQDPLVQFISEHYAHNDQVRDPLIKAWLRFSELNVADKEFQTEFASGNTARFFQRIWEMNLALHLSDQGHKISSKRPGPDFRFEYDGHKVLVEAVCPEPKGLPDGWLEIPDITEKPKVTSYPSKEILLRWTSVLFDKKKVFEKYGAENIIEPADCQVIAVSGCQLSRWASLDLNGISGFPFALEATLPIGPRFIKISRETMETVETGYSYRASIRKENGSPVRTDTFLDPAYSHISAVLGSNAGLNEACGHDKFYSILVHNPLAKNPLPKGLMGADIEYRVDHDEHSISITEI